MQIILPEVFLQKHEQAIKLYLSDESRLDKELWQRLYEAINLLDQAKVIIDKDVQTFRHLYDIHIDQAFADEYIDELLALLDVAAKSPAVTAKFARQITPTLEQAQLLQRNIPKSWLLAAYCIYWWQSFARGYAFEVEIMHDLERSGITFTMHNIRKRFERYSPADLVVLNLSGDIKASTYFLHWLPETSLTNDFYITRLYDKGRMKTLAVFQKPFAWLRIGGNAPLLGQLDNVVDLLPQPVQLQRGNITLIVIDFDTWKNMVKTRQADKGGNHE